MLSKVMKVTETFFSKQILNAKRLQKGQVWYIKLPKAHSCIKVSIADLTRETVLLKGLGDSSSRHSSRYEISEIRWVEELDGTEKI